MAKLGSSDTDLRRLQDACAKSGSNGRLARLSASVGSLLAFRPRSSLSERPDRTTQRAWRCGHDRRDQATWIRAGLADLCFRETFMKPDKLVVLMPVFNDWDSVDRLLVLLDAELRDQQARVLLVDDGSVDCWQGPLETKFEHLEQVDVLRLRRNLGHQRAICVGLCHVAAAIPCDRVVVMDSDGQDDPADVPRLLAESYQQNGTNIVFGERTRRSEGMLFRVLYLIYRGLHSILVGHPVRVGNFSVIPGDRLRSLTVVPELWSHYAAAVFTARLPHCNIPTHRAKRLEGRSKMELEGLIVHGLSAISAFSDRVGVRMLTIIAPLTASVLALLLTGVAVAAPRWATLAAGLFLILFFELLFFTLIFCFIILSNRASSLFIPARDYSFFIDRTRTVFPRS